PRCPARTPRRNRGQATHRAQAAAATLPSSGSCNDECRSTDDRFVASLLAAAVDPRDLDLLAFGAALELEGEKRILGDRRTPLRGQHGLAAVGCRDGLDEPRWNDLSLRVLALPGLNFVADDRLHFVRVADQSSPYLHRFWHDFSLAAAATQGDLDFLGRHVILAVRLHERVDVGRLRHLDARRYRGIGAWRSEERRVRKE